eukprot:scaffold176195_cov28-Tisochrysis_lutea.AAC.2
MPIGQVNVTRASRQEGGLHMRYPLWGRGGGEAAEAWGDGVVTEWSGRLCRIAFSPRVDDAPD